MSERVGRQRTRNDLLILLVFSIFAPIVSSAEVQISKLGDFDLTTWSGAGEKRDNFNCCVYNSDGPAYKIRASIAGIHSRFELSGCSSTVPFILHWNSTTGPSEVEMPFDSFMTTAGADSSPTCANYSGYNANLEIVVTAASLENAVACSNYSATVYLTLSPTP